ncbi:hypothetical protein DIPPA_03381 [Diplonema papillatum]|nr:hypothetical protein DIPPA_03381 [Diplonema papillatum]|eukprot:gene16483-25276_t
MARSLLLASCAVLAAATNEEAAILLSNEEGEPVPLKQIGRGGELLEWTSVPNAGAFMFTGTYDGMWAWTDTDDARLTNFSAALLDVTGVIPSYFTGRGFTVQFLCKRGSVFNARNLKNFVACDVFFIMYYCEDCDLYNDEVAQQLLTTTSPKWYTDGYGGMFTLSPSSPYTHAMRLFQAETLVGTSVSVKLVAPVRFSLWALSGKSVYCAGKLAKDECLAEDTCRWSDAEGACRPQTASADYQCPLACKVCVEVEAPLYPVISPEAI